MTPLGRPHAVLFDWDNTLVDTWPTIHAALNDMFAALDRPAWSLEQTKRRVRASLRDSFPALFGERWTEARELYLAAFRARHIAALRPAPGAEAVLRELRDANIYLGVVSNKTGALLRAEAEALGWTGYFGALIGAQDARADKPDRAPVDLALIAHRPALDPGRGDPGIWLVGDTAIDMACAYAAGIAAILVGAPDGEDFAGCEPHRRVIELSDVAVIARALR